MSVTADFDAQPAVERELVLRLASLLWRLRRAIAIETGLLHRHAGSGSHGDDPLSTPTRGATTRVNRLTQDGQLNWSGKDEITGSVVPPYTDNLEIAGCFLRLTKIDGASFDLLGRYEKALWRQVGQILFTLDAALGRRPRPRSPSSRSVHEFENSPGFRRRASVR